MLTAADLHRDVTWTGIALNVARGTYRHNGEDVRIVMVREGAEAREMFEALEWVNA